MYLPGEFADPYRPRPKDSPAVAAWRARMGTAEAAEVYKLRASTVEWVCDIAGDAFHPARRVRGVSRHVVSPPPSGFRAYPTTTVSAPATFTCVSLTAGPRSRRSTASPLSAACSRRSARPIAFSTPVCPAVPGRS